MPENPASYRVVRTKSYLFNKAAKRKNVEPRQDGIFKRFTLLVVGYIKEKFIWARKKPPPVSVDAEHDKRIAENYVFDEVQGIYVPRAEYERRARFNKDDYKPTPDEVRRFPSRPKLDQTEHNISLDLITPIQSESKRKYIPRLKPPNHR